MSKQELSALIQNPQWFEEFARSAFDTFDVKKDGHLCSDELGMFLMQATNDLNQPSPSSDLITEVTEYLAKPSEGKEVSFEDFKLFLMDVFKALVQEAD